LVVGGGGGVNGKLADADDAEDGRRNYSIYGHAHAALSGKNGALGSDLLEIPHRVVSRHHRVKHDDPVPQACLRDCLGASTSRFFCLGRGLLPSRQCPSTIDSQSGQCEKSNERYGDKGSDRAVLPTSSTHRTA